LGEVGSIPESDINAMAEGIDRVLKDAADRSLEKCRAKTSSGKNIWWIPEFSSMRQDMV